jgi:hypothetical protein
MTRSILGGAAAVLILCSVPSVAQVAPEGAVNSDAAPAAALVPIAPPSGNAVLRSGTDARFRLLEELTTKGKKLRVSDRVRLEVAEPILVQGVTVIPVGTPVVGEITEVRNKGMWGKSGKFTARLLYMSVGGRQIRVTGEFDDKGKAGGVGAAAVSALVFLPAGFFMTGTSALLPAGTVVGGFIDEDVPVVLQAQSAPAPLVVGAPAMPIQSRSEVALVQPAAADSGAQARCWRERTC